MARMKSQRVASSDIHLQSLVVEAEGAVRVLEESVGGKHGVVRLDHGGGHLGGGGHRERQLRLAPVVHREPLEEERSEAGSRPAAGGVEDEETLEAGAVVGELADPVED